LKARFKLPAFGETGANIARVYIADMSGKVFAFLSTILLIRFLAVEDYGSFVVFTAVANLFGMTISNGMGSAIVAATGRARARSAAEATATLRQGLAFEFGVWVLLLPAASLLAEPLASLMFGSPHHVGAFRLGLLGGFGITVFQSVATILQANEQFAALGKVVFAKSVVLFVVYVVLVAVGVRTYEGMAIGTVIAQVVLGLLIFVIVRGLVSRVNIDQSGATRALVAAGMGLIFYNVVVSAMSQADVIILSRYRPVEDVATYGVGYRYYLLGLMAIGSVHAVLLPRVARTDLVTSKHKRDQFMKQWVATVRVLALPIVVVILIGGWAMPWINGPAYDGAVPIFQVLSAGLIFTLLFSPAVNILIVDQRHRTLACLALVGLALNIGGSLWAVTRFGSLGVAVSTASSFAVFNGLTHAFARRSRPVANLSGGGPGRGRSS
jgi:O-antigen/teichoic acid export membrane protein